MFPVNYSLFGLGCTLRFGLEYEKFIQAWVQNDHDPKHSQVLIVHLVQAQIFIYTQAQINSSHPFDIVPSCIFGLVGKYYMKSSTIIWAC